MWPEKQSNDCFFNGLGSALEDTVTSCHYQQEDQGQQRELPTGPFSCLEGSALAGVSLPFVRLTRERGNPCLIDGSVESAVL